MIPTYLPLRDSHAATATLAPNMNVAQHDLMRLSVPDANHMGGHLDMDVFDPDMNFENDGLLCVLLLPV